jgi:hypothetical protein
MSVIPEYTPERAYMFERERSSVRAKIGKIIDLHHTASLDEIRGRHENMVDASFRTLSWLDRCAECAKHSDLDWNEQQQAKLDEIAKTMLYRILDGDQMLQASFERENHLVKDGSANFKGESLVEIYLNHVTRESLSQIKSMGFSDRSAVSIGGQVIKKSLGFSSQSFSVKPYYNPEISTDANVSKIYSHWKLMRDVLNDDHETNTLGLFGRGQLLS